MLHKTWPAFFLLVVLRVAKTDGKSLNKAGRPRKWSHVEENSKLGWSAWSSWSTCNEKICCRHGVSLRRRNCTKEPCTAGIESETEDCPKRNCKECPSGPLSQTALATTGSFINMECETTRKYSAYGLLSSLLIPPSLYKKFPVLKNILRRSFFGIQNFFVPSRSRKAKKFMVYKLCFEPKEHLTAHQAEQVFESNRKVRLPSPKKYLTRKRVNAIVITMLPNGQLFEPGIYFTVVGHDGLTAFFRRENYILL